MAMDGAEAKPSSPSTIHSCSSRHYYLAVDRIQFKMETLIDLLGVTGRHPGLPIVICCSSRDELDALCATVSNLTYVSLSSLYSDLGEIERAMILEKFREITGGWNWKITTDPGNEHDTGTREHKSNVLVMTDACLPLLTPGETRVSAQLLINYELPTKKFDKSFRQPEATLFLYPGWDRQLKKMCMKYILAEETYLRRMSTCLASGGVVINMVVGGEVATLKSLEESSGFLIAEMPINVSELL